MEESPGTCVTGTRSAPRNSEMSPGVVEAWWGDGGETKPRSNLSLFEEPLDIGWSDSK